MINNCCIWLTGLSGAGKTTIALELIKRLKELNLVEGKDFEYLDGDIVRQTLCKDLGFSKEDRDENIKRISYVSSYLSHTRITICAFISPYIESRNKIRNLSSNFIEVYVKCPLNICEERDVKGLYAKARSGLIKNFTGIDDPYEPPLNPELTLETDNLSLDECVSKIIDYLNEH